MALSEWLHKVPPGTLLVALVVAWLVYLVALAIYRLYLHPLAKFPGPRLAALTQWYEFYYDVSLRGQFLFKVEEMHKKYGSSVVRRQYIKKLTEQGQLCVLLLTSCMLIRANSGIHSM